MSKILFSLLLATSVATPALAAERPTSADRQTAREERQAVRAQAREDRSKAREDRSQASEERVQVREQRVQQPTNFQAPQQDVRVREQVVRESRPANVNERGRPTIDERAQTRDSVSNWRSDQRAANQQQMEQRIERNRVRAPQGARPDRPAPMPSTAYNQSTRTPTWDRNWRNNNHYDWRNYRHHHRSTFHLGLYYDPFGWGYQRYNVGWRLWPNYYSSNYWLNDPSMYALPYAPWPYRWVRYYDDALLVNTFNGQVVDVMYDFFW